MDDPTELIPMATLVEMAKNAHDCYRQSLRDSGLASPDRTADTAWEELREFDRQQNIDQVRTYVTRLQAHGYTWVPDRDPMAGEVIDQLPEALIDELGRAEHDRWMKLKLKQGYRRGPVRNDTEGNLQHPDLRHWEDLDAATQEIDLSMVRTMIGRLRNAGYVVVRAA